MKFCFRLESTELIISKTIQIGLELIELKVMARNRVPSELSTCMFLVLLY